MLWKVNPEFGARRRKRQATQVEAELDFFPFGEPQAPGPLPWPSPKVREARQPECAETWHRNNAIALKAHGGKKKFRRFDIHPQNRLEDVATIIPKAP